jgi:two-component system, OmpR family, copper resistance phosphate regulon response regulator CusR
MRVLLVEDDLRMARLIARSLKEDGHAVVVSHDGAEGLDLARGNFDAVVLDIMLPKIDGLEILKTIRAERRTTPILMLTARDAMQEMTGGLNLGADDYLTKPFHVDVFLARVRAVSRRGQATQCTNLEVGCLTLNRATHELRCGEDAILLTHKEYIVLELLMRRAGQVVLRNQLIEAAWGFDSDIGDNSLDVCVSSLRNKLSASENRQLIRNSNNSRQRVCDG